MKAEKKPNIIIILTDQERYPTHWPEETDGTLFDGLSTLGGEMQITICDIYMAPQNYKQRDSCLGG